MELIFVALLPALQESDSGGRCVTNMDDELLCVLLSNNSCNPCLIRSAHEVEEVVVVLVEEEALRILPVETIILRLLIFR